MEDADQPGKEPGGPQDGEHDREKAQALPSQEQEEFGFSPSYSVSTSDNEEDPGPAYHHWHHHWHHREGANRAPQSAQEASEQKQPYVPYAQLPLREQYAELTRARQEKDLEKKRRKALKEKQKNNESIEIAHLRARICFEDVEEFKKEACAEYEKAVADFRVAYDSVVKNAKFLEDFKMKTEQIVKNIVEQAKKEMSASSQALQECKIPVPQEDISEWMHSKYDDLEVGEILKADKWAHEGPHEVNQRRMREREIIEGSKKRKKLEKVACKYGSKCWAITRRKYCPYSHKEEAPVGDKRRKREDSESSEGEAE